MSTFLGQDLSIQCHVFIYSENPDANYFYGVGLPLNVMFCPAANVAI